MSKSPHTSEFRVKVSQEYLDGLGSYEFLSTKYKISATAIREWVGKYRKHGVDAFSNKAGCTSYSAKYKKRCVNEVITGEGSIDDIVFKYNLTTRKVLIRWLECYNANRELKDYYPKSEVYMAEARRKTTIEERKVIVDYCLKHNRDYKGTASTYGVSYDQVYSWVRKFEADGKEGLLDKRGHHKTEEELDEVDRLRREVQRLKLQLEEKDMAVELLKKVKELEGM